MSKINSEFYFYQLVKKEKKRMDKMKSVKIKNEIFIFKKTGLLIFFKTIKKMIFGKIII